MKSWGGCFNKQANTLTEEFTASICFDTCLYKVDILGSLAHIRMLEKCGVLKKGEVKRIAQGLKKIRKKIEKGEIKFSIAAEDIHMNIEMLLHIEIGELAGKLHTGRSRNDQTALDLHLYLRQEVLGVMQKISFLQQAMCKQAKQHINTIMPGYTHLQRAVPVRLAHHLLAYIAMFDRDLKRLKNSWSRINTMPLGAGALAGTGYKTDRKYLAQLLGFDTIYKNSIDAVSDRDFIVEFLSHASIIMMHLSRLSEELILWSSKEFNFIELDDAYCTGSSMMPQKKNPDVAELVRGKTGRVYGSLIATLTMLKGLPLAYNKDLQEDKENLFDTLKTLHDSLNIYAPMISAVTFKLEPMLNAVKNDFLNATMLANYLTDKGIPFRQAHHITGKIVLYCIKNNSLLSTLALEDYQKFSPLIDKSIYAKLEPEQVVETYNTEGGTAKAAVSQQITKALINFKQTEQWIEDSLLKIKMVL